MLGFTHDLILCSVLVPVIRGVFKYHRKCDNPMIKAVYVLHGSFLLLIFSPNFLKPPLTPSITHFENHWANTLCFVSFYWLASLVIVKKKSVFPVGQLAKYVGHFFLLTDIILISCRVLFRINVHVAR